MFNYEEHNYYSLIQLDFFSNNRDTTELEPEDDEM